MLAVVVPAQDDQERIGACLKSLHVAAACPLLRGEATLLIVALDDSTDRTGEIARRWGAFTVENPTRNVGMARALGARFALEAGARWLAFTDADSVVAPDWLHAQVAARADAVCGAVEFDDLQECSESVRRRHAMAQAAGQRRVHGGNFGVSSRAYVEAGGFPPLRASEDVALVEALQGNGSTIAWSAAPRVMASARRRYGSALAAP